MLFFTFFDFFWSNLFLSFNLDFKRKKQTIKSDELYIESLHGRASRVFAGHNVFLVELTLLPLPGKHF
jgi:hypothetical protein